MANGKPTFQGHISGAKGIPVAAGATNRQCQWLSTGANVDQNNNNNNNRWCLSTRMPADVGPQRARATLTAEHEPRAFGAPMGASCGRLAVVPRCCCCRSLALFVAPFSFWHFQGPSFGPQQSVVVVPH